MIGQKFEIQGYHDERGLLMAINHILFEAKRIFIISDVPEGAVRGNHFSKTSEFLYVVVKGGCRVELDNGYYSEIYELSIGDGLQFSKNTWMKLYDFQRESVLCVLSDNEYFSTDYIADYEEFKRIVREEDV